VEQAADWDRQWREEPFDPEAPHAEARTLRWREQERLVRERLGGFAGLRAIEIGAGRGLNAFLFAERGSRVTLLDLSPVALEQAERLFAAHGLAVEPCRGDAFDPPRELVGAFDLSMSYGLCEHFLGERRRAIVAAHLRLVRPGGIALLGVPNRYSPVYRLWVKALMARGSWPLGTEVPFSPREVAELARGAGGEPLAPRFGSFLGSLVNHGVNQVLFKLGRRGLPVPQVRVPVLDRMAYELLVPVVKPAA
jgi:2-polyprenyl-6-hydroxyphenyl methylase/3-demethylubiquinone-9 3-methyltransferase